MKHSSPSSTADRVGRLLKAAAMSGRRSVYSAPALAVEAHPVAVLYDLKSIAVPFRSCSQPAALGGRAASMVMGLSVLSSATARFSLSHPARLFWRPVGAEINDVMAEAKQRSTTVAVRIDEARQIEIYAAPTISVDVVSPLAHEVAPALGARKLIWAISLDAASPTFRPARH